MVILLTILYIVACFILIAVVLLQKGESGDLAVTFGGAATQTVFGARGAASFLSKITITAAVVFILGALVLSILKSRTGPSVLEGAAPAEPPAITLPSGEGEPTSSSGETPVPPLPTAEPEEEGEAEPPSER